MPDIEEIHRRICRLHGTTWDAALLFVAADGGWRVIRHGHEPVICRRLVDAGMFVGAYTSEVPFNRLREDVEAHLHEMLE